MKRDPYANLRANMGTPPKAWRSIEHKNMDPVVMDTIDVEMPNGVPKELTAMQRRDVLKLAGASVALAGLTGACVRRPEEEIRPYVKQPEEIIPGRANYYATVMPRSEGAVGLVVEAHEGRPTKIEGNDLHPGSLGASDAWAQNEVLKLYDPDRKRAPMSGGKDTTWAEFDKAATTLATASAQNQGKGLAFVLDGASQPTLDRLLGDAQKKMPNAKLYRYDAVSGARSDAGAAAAFGAGSRVVYDLDKAKVVVALDSNFLLEGPDHIRMARDFGKGRRVLQKSDAANMNRMYAIEGVLSCTGATADHRLRVASSDIGGFVTALGQALGVDVPALGNAPAGSEATVKAIAKDLSARKSESVLVVGERQPPAVHAAVRAINAALGSKAARVVQSDVLTALQSVGDINALAADLDAQAIETLVIFDVNLAYSAPVKGMADKLKKAKSIIYCGVMHDETAALSSWYVPMAHFLESWGDARAWDGTAAITQPLILPLFSARAAVTLMAQLTGNGETNDRKLVAETHAGLGDRGFKKALHDGVIAGSAYGPGSSTANSGSISTLAASYKPQAVGSGNFELVIMRGNLLDGRLANVSWAQELPDPITKLCWDNALIMAPATAAALGIDSKVKANAYDATIVELSANGASIKAPVFITPGYAPNTVAMNWGYGKRGGGDIAKGAGLDSSSFHNPDPNVAVGHGVDPQPLMAGDSYVISGVKITKTSESVTLCSTQDHFTAPSDPFNEITFTAAALLSGKADPQRQLGLARRPLYRKSTLKIYGQDNSFVMKGDIPANLVEPKVEGDTNPRKPLQPIGDIIYDNQQWGMVIDLTACTGCNWCVIACQAENNIPSVGRTEVLMGREMHWLRIDRYFVGDVDQPDAVVQPVNCMQCELAPCEPVCPVGATVHDDEGLNAMAYNRCIGTRYCANNCPYKVRRFNYLDFTTSANIYRVPYSAERVKTLQLQRNPNVTVRYRGTMEKCTYCTQRVEEAKIEAKRNGQDRKNLPDGAVTPACAQACPTNAIVFGNINNKDSVVSQYKASDRNYELLQDINVRPRTTYLARVKNTNEELG